jgi:hypothetical protein
MIDGVFLCTFCDRVIGRLLLHTQTKLCVFISGCSSVGRVHVWGACGRTFKSCHPDILQLKPLISQGFFYSLNHLRTVLRFKTNFHNDLCSGFK